MNKYLIELFKEENTVIIPGLGALTVVNRATNELMFMSYLKHNDGTLVKYIAQQENIEPDAAKENIDRYVEEIIAAIANGGAFEVDGLGRFSKDASGEIQFSSTQQAPAEETGPVIVPKVEEQEEVKEVVQEQPVEEVVIEDAQNKAEEKVAETIEEYTESAEEIITNEPDEPLIVPVEPVQPVPVTEEEQWNDDLDVPPVNYQPERPKKPILEKTKKDKKPRRNGTLWLLLITLIIMGGAAYVGFNYKDLKEKIPFLASSGKEEVKGTENPVEDEITKEQDTEPEENETWEEATDEELTEEPVTEPVAAPEEKKPEEKPKPAPVVASGGLRVDKSLPVQVIVGSFGEEGNAGRMVEKLRSQGFPAEIIGIYGGLHTVSAASFSSMEEYRANQSQLQSVGKYWVKN